MYIVRFKSYLQSTTTFTIKHLKEVPDKIEMGSF